MEEQPTTVNVSQRHRTPNQTLMLSRGFEHRRGIEPSSPVYGTGWTRQIEWTLMTTSILAHGRISPFQRSEVHHKVESELRTERETYVYSIELGM